MEWCWLFKNFLILLKKRGFIKRCKKKFLYYKVKIVGKFLCKIMVYSLKIFLNI